MKHYSSIALIISAIFSSCSYQQAYYVSPFNGNSNTYHATPLLSDSVKSAIYLSGNMYSGSANYNGSDDVINFEGDVYRTQQFGLLEAYYGLNASFGNYDVAELDSDYTYSTVNYQLINSMAGSKSFGGVGAEGGINFTLPMAHGEWRLFGMEVSSHKEFGSYLDFRNLLPDSAATLIIKNSFFSTLGFYSELVKKVKHGSYGFRIASGTILESAYHNLNIYDNTGSDLKFRYTDLTFDYTWEQWTGYIQSKSATKASGVKLGIIYRLGKME